MLQHIRLTFSLLCHRWQHIFYTDVTNICHFLQLPIIPWSEMSHSLHILSTHIWVFIILMLKMFVSELFALWVTKKSVHNPASSKNIQFLFYCVQLLIFMGNQHAETKVTRYYGWLIDPSWSTFIIQSKGIYHQSQL